MTDELSRRTMGRIRARGRNAEGIEAVMAEIREARAEALAEMAEERIEEAGGRVEGDLAIFPDPQGLLDTLAPRDPDRGEG